MIAHEFALCDAVLDVVKAETRLDPFLGVLVRQGVDEVVIAEKQTSTSLLKALGLLVSIRHVDDIEEGFVCHDEKTCSHSDCTVEALPLLNERFLLFLLGV